MASSAHIASGLKLCLAEVLRGLRNFLSMTGQSTTALIALRKEGWRKEAPGIPSSDVGFDLCSTRQVLALFHDQPWGDY